LAEILHDAIQAGILEKQMVSESLASGKKKVKLDKIWLSLGLDGFNMTKATVTGVSAVAIRVLNLPYHIQNHAEFAILPVVIPISEQKQNEASFLRLISDALFNLEQCGLHVETADMIIQADVCVHSVTGDTPQLIKLAGMTSYNNQFPCILCKVPAVHCSGHFRPIVKPHDARLHQVRPRDAFTSGNASLKLNGNSDYGFDRFKNNHDGYFYAIDEMHLFGHGIAGRLLDAFTTKPKHVPGTDTPSASNYGNLLYIPPPAWNSIKQCIIEAEKDVSDAIQGFGKELFAKQVRT
ncbi:hypothetical protein IWW43_002931, partial [Coemansia sp. RSA 1935]